jgi:hypothetical protein
MSNIFTGKKFYTTPVNGWTTVWATDDCERCGCETEAPNSVKVAARGLGHIFDRMGITRREIDVGELGYSDAYDGAVCPDCYAECEAADDYDGDPGDMDGDHASALASCGWGTDEDYGCYDGGCDDF